MIMYDGIKAEGGIDQQGAIFYCFFFVILVMFGNCILLNVWLPYVVFVSLMFETCSVIVYFTLQHVY